MRERSVLHVDLDAFFVAVERVRDPRLRGRPVVVGGAPEQRGVVAAASYEAREHGIHSAMPMGQALRLCPHLVRVPGDSAAYERASRDVFRLLGDYTPVVEQVSVDEGYLDLTGTQRLLGRAVDVAGRLQREVKERLRLDLTVGVARNRLVSKVASDFAKPAGLFDVRPGLEARFFAPLPVRALPGIGPVTGKRLADLNIERLGTLASTEEWFLEEVFGSYGPLLRSRARGEDDTPVCPPWELPEQKSIGHEETFARDSADFELLRGKLQELLEQAARRLRHEGLLARKLTLKLRYADFVSETRDWTFPNPTDHDMELLEPALELLQRMAARRTLVRLLGVRLGGLQRGYWQGSLWDARRVRERRLIAALDRVADRYGTEGLRIGRLAQSPAFPVTKRPVSGWVQKPTRGPSCIPSAHLPGPASRPPCS
ncbi:MAG: DNA polymerase IV [Planctomycetota bacterium]|nr:MAG: DNA polymerase IV [Planctomycetota bacterium]